MLKKTRKSEAWILKSSGRFDTQYRCKKKV